MEQRDDYVLISTRALKKWNEEWRRERALFLKIGRHARRIKRRERVDEYRS